MEDNRFGGWSGFELSEDGTQFVAITDKGTIATGTIRRDDTGRIEAMQPENLVPLRLSNGKTLPKYYTDSEGLGVAPDGRVFVAFESTHRVVAYPDAGGRGGETLPVPKSFARYKPNTSLEALAIGPDGTLYVIPEAPPGRRKSFPVYRFRNGAWDSKFKIAQVGDLNAVGADFGPDGRLYLLERAFHGIFGFSSRVRRFDVEEQGLTNEKVLLETDAGEHDNLEGLAVWRDRAGKIRLTMVADDNFKFFQSNEVVEYVVDE